MSEFVASNGVTVRSEPDGRLKLIADFIGPLDKHEVAALREFFRDERDRELGRWRDPEHPGIFAVGFDHNPDTVQVVKEVGGTAYAQYRRFETRGSALDPMHKVAHAYFEAHPEPKPWQDAKPGEVWVLDYTGFRDVVCHVTGDEKFISSSLGFIPLDKKYPVVGTLALAITAGRRIWPEGGDES